MNWVPDPSFPGGFVAGEYSVYEIRPGEWRGIHLGASKQSCVCKRANLVLAKAACEEHAAKQQLRKDLRTPSV